MNKKDQLLKKQEHIVTEYDLTDEEIMEVASLVALIEQADAARNFIYSRIAERAAERHGISDKNITFNFNDIMTKGAKHAKLIVSE